MLIENGNIWDHHRNSNWIVITTNIGWKRNGHNPMGAGIAKAAAELYPDLPAYYGGICKKYQNDTAVCEYPIGKFILFPTKALNREQPWASWRAKSSIDLIIASTKQLAYLKRIRNYKNIGLPLVGCQNGGLSASDIIPILYDILDDDFILFMS